MARVLVVEDDADNREIVARFLARAGHQVIEATTGLDGVRLAGEQKPDLILMDLNLPELDGWEATKRIRANPACEKVPVIALTAHSKSDDVKRALDAGCDDYETKPVVYLRLMRKIQVMLSRNAA
jgi:two-component system, cell cycle response regulator DivK